MFHIGTSDMFTACSAFLNISRAKGGSPLKPSVAQAPIYRPKVSTRSRLLIIRGWLYGR